MQKQWSLKAISQAHNYSKINRSSHHDIFSDWINRNYNDSKIDILDIGGGNGSVCLSIEDKINSYFCVDINEENIRIGSEFFKNNSNISFEKMDIDCQDLEQNFDVIYIDSVLTMLENPFGVLKKIASKTDYIFLNRTIFSSITEKSSYQWGGMNVPSTLWKFSQSDIQSFCVENGFEFNVFNNISFYIKTKK